MIKRFVPFAVISTLLLVGSSARADQLTFKGKSTGTAAAGSYVNSAGETRTSTDKGVESQKDYVKRYDGDVVLELNYNIVFKDDKSLDTDKSSITIDTKSFTYFGKEATQKFTTSPIKITDVTLNNGDPTMIKSFKFGGTDWYDPKSGSFNAIINKGISGQVDLANGTASYDASYIYKGNATLSTFTVTGKVEKGPGPIDIPTYVAPEHIYAPVPEADAGSMALGALSMLGCMSAVRRARRAPRREPCTG